jgi:Protein RETICULATA-related
MQKRLPGMLAITALSVQGVVFGLVGFCAGVIGTSLSNGLIALRKRLDPKFEVPDPAAHLECQGRSLRHVHCGPVHLVKRATSEMQQVQNESPAVLSNSAVWATHMGVSSNVRYQALNGLDMVSRTFQRLLNANVATKPVFHQVTHHAATNAC